MKFANPLIPARLDKRYKRFLADVTLDDGQTVTVACPNTGTMLGLTTPGARVWLSNSDNPNRKYAHTWELIETDVGAGPVMVGINPNVPNVLVAEAIAAEAIPQLAGYAQLRREVKYGLNSRIDILLDGSADARPCYVEIKNVHMMRAPGLAEFPDCKTERGAKHLDEMSRMVAEGCRAVMVYLVQRADAERFSLAADIDPAYRAAYDRALAAGVEMLAYRCHVSVDDISLVGPLPITQA